MKMSKMCAVLTVSGGLLFQLAFGAAGALLAPRSAYGQTETRCAVKSYIKDDDPNGTNVRAAPDKNSRVLQRIRNDEVIVSVTGFSSGWFKISAVEDLGGDKLFQGSGWIYFALLGMQVAEADPRLYAESKKGSRFLMNLKPGKSAVDLISCQNDWVKIQTAGKVGWLSPAGQCGNPVTTCP